MASDQMDSAQDATESESTRVQFSLEFEDAVKME